MLPGVQGLKRNVAASEYLLRAASVSSFSRLRNNHSDACCNRQTLRRQAGPIVFSALEKPHRDLGSKYPKTHLVFAVQLCFAQQGAAMSVGTLAERHLSIGFLRRMSRFEIAGPPPSE
jgi:hypothetical protein